MTDNDMRLIEAKHLRAMESLDRAFDAGRHGDVAAANQAFEEAFQLEKQAAEAMAPHLDVEPTRSVLLRSAAALALECRNAEEAERLACLGLSGRPPTEIRNELRDILIKVWQPAVA